MTLYINSHGGDSQTALGIYDLLMVCERCVVGVVVGQAESAASLILQACHRRVITVNSALMLHGSHLHIEGSVQNAQAAVNRFRECDDLYCKIYAERSKQDPEHIYQMMRRDAYFNAAEAQMANLVDEII